MKVGFISGFFLASLKWAGHNLRHYSLKKVEDIKKGEKSTELSKLINNENLSTRRLKKKLIRVRKNYLYNTLHIEIDNWYSIRLPLKSPSIYLKPFETNSSWSLCEKLLTMCMKYSSVENRLEHFLSQYFKWKKCSHEFFCHTLLAMQIETDTFAWAAHKTERDWNIEMSQECEEKFYTIKVSVFCEMDYCGLWRFEMIFGYFTWAL